MTFLLLMLSIVFYCCFLQIKSDIQKVLKGEF